MTVSLTFRTNREEIITMIILAGIIIYFNSGLDGEPKTSFSKSVIPTMEYIRKRIDRVRYTKFGNTKLKHMISSRLTGSYRSFHASVLL